MKTTDDSQQIIPEVYMLCKKVGVDLGIEPYFWPDIITLPPDARIQRKN